MSLTDPTPISCDPSPDNQINDFGKSPLRFEFEAHLEEYRRFRQEMSGHYTNQQQIINLAILFLGALITLWQLFYKDLLNTTDGASSSINPHLTFHYALLISSIVFSIFSVMQYWHDLMIAQMWQYINEVLKLKIENILNITYPNEYQQNKISVWEWETWVIKNQKGKVVEYLMGMARYATTFIPSIGLLIYYFIDRPFSFDIYIWEQILFFLAAIIFIINLYCAIYDARFFLVFMVREKNKPN